MQANMTEVTLLAQKLESEGARLADYFASLDAQQWKTEVYTEGSIWTIRNILAHLVTSEQAFIKLFAAVRDGGPGVSEDFSIDRYNARQQEKTRELEPDMLLGQFRAVRADMVRLVSSLQPEDLDKMGRHPYLQQTTLREMVKMVYLHNQIHLRDLKKVLKGTAAE